MNLFRIFLCILFISFSITLNAQMPGGGRGQMGGGQNMNLGHFYGKLVDSITNKPVEAASVQLIQNKLDTVTKKKTEIHV